MKNKLDELFSIEKLRRNWELPETEDAEPAASDAEDEFPPEPLGVFLHLTALINGRFSEETREPLTFLLDELENLLRQRFAESENAGDIDVESLNLAIETLLNSIEDLTDALMLES